MAEAAARLAEDAGARTRALELASFIVEAPAGAGKTELLTQRYLRLLGTVDHPEEVLALTFTNKAAAEMRDRILGNLEAAARGEVAEQPHRRLTGELARAALARDAGRGWGLLAHPGRLRITTIDALCASLARQMPFLSRFGSQPGVTEDADAHYADAARRTLELVEEDGPDGEVVAAALAFMSNDAVRLERLLVAMLNRRDQWLPHATRLDGGSLRAEVEAGFAAVVERELAAVAERLDAAAQRGLMPLARLAAANAPGLCDPLLDWQLPLAGELGALPQWQALAALLLTGKGEFRRTVNKATGFPAGKEFAEAKAAMLARLDELRGMAGLAESLAAVPGLPDPRLADDEWATIECFARLLRLAAAQLWLVFQEAREVDFIEVAARAGTALGDEDAPTDLAQALDYRIRHLLVDEFQDTAPGQVELLERLMRGWVPGDGRTLFVVGDPMQSIYRFRKADVGLFLRVREHGIGGLRLEHLRLYRNNRSFAGVVDWVNAAFPAIFPDADSPEAGAVRYAPSAATRPADAAAGVTLHPVIAGVDGDADAAEASLVLDLVRAAKAADPGGRIAILVRARRHLDALAAAIRRDEPGLRFQAVDIESLADRQHVQDLLTLFSALHHRADRVHWLALLRAPWCGLTLADLHALAAGERRRTLWELMNDPARCAALSEDGRARLAHVRDVLALAFAERDRRPPRRWLEGTWLMLGGPRCLEAPAALADVDAFFGLVDRLTAAGRLDPETLAARAAELYAPPDPGGGAVQMMTIHKAKGLEFETVIVPGLHRTTGNNDSQLLLWDEFAGADGHEHLLVAPIRARGATDDAASAYRFLQALEARRTANESQRLLYVATTRAIRRLHLVGCAVPDPGKDDGLKPPPAGSLLRLLWPGIAQPVFAASLADARHAEMPAPAIDPATYVPPLLRLATPAVPEALRVLPGLRPADNPPASLDGDEAPSLEAAVGTLVHRVLEIIAREGVAGWPAPRIATLEPAWRRWLAARGHAAPDAASGAADAVRALQATLASADGRWLLAAHPEAAAEQAWSSREGDVAVNHVIDRVFVADGCRWIVDYKTVRAADDELPARAEGFRPQLERYARLFAGDPRPLRMAIFFTLQARLVELAPAPR